MFSRRVCLRILRQSSLASRVLNSNYRELPRTSRFLPLLAATTLTLHSAFADEGPTVQLPRSDFPNNASTPAKLPDGTPVLVHNFGGKFSVTSAKCSHYGFDLGKGVSALDPKLPTVTCPLHDATFDVRSGRAVRGATVDGISVFPVVSVSEQFLTVGCKAQTEPPLAKRDPKNPAVAAIIGGGPATVAAIHGLRSAGYTGRVVVFSEDAELPYDRVVLSKKFPDGTSLGLKAETWYEELDVEWRPQTQVTKLENKTLRFRGVDAQEEEVNFDKCLIATGCAPRVPAIPGVHLKNVFVLRSVRDWEKISEAVRTTHREKKKVVIIGSGFIGTEMASLLKSKADCDVTVVGSTAVPFERVFGRRVGSYYAKLYAANKVDYRQGRAKLIRGRDGRLGDVSEVSLVELDDGDMIQADVVLLAVGTVPNSGVFSELPIGSDGGILVDPLLRVQGRDDVYAAGDVARFPSIHAQGKDLRVEHWDAAMDMGRVAGRNMAGGFAVYQEVPFFWTNAFGKSVRWVGVLADVGEATDNWDNVLIEGDLNEGKFVAYYVKSGRVAAVATSNMDPVAVAAGELMRKNKMPSVAEIQLGTVNAQTILQLAKSL